MRTLLLFFVIASATFASSAQSLEGIYTNRWEAPSGEAIAYDLTLNENGTFTFQSTRTYLDGIPQHTVKATGTWVLNGHLLTLQSNETDNELSSNLNMNKARYVSISSRNPDFNLVNPSFKFYESDVFYAKDMELIKTESSVTSTN